MPLYEVADEPMATDDEKQPEETKLAAESTEDTAARERKQIEDWQGERIYFNGFTNFLGVADFTILLKRNDKPVAVLNTSYTVAKTLAVKLMDLVKTLENQCNTSIMTTDQVREGLRRKREREKGDDVKH